MDIFYNFCNAIKIITTKIYLVNNTTYIGNNIFNIITNISCVID